MTITNAGYRLLHTLRERGCVATMDHLNHSVTCEGAWTGGKPETFSEATMDLALATAVETMWRRDLYPSEIPPRSIPVESDTLRTVQTSLKAVIDSTLPSILPGRIDVSQKALTTLVETLYTLPPA